MRRLLSLLCLGSSLVLIGAATPAPRALAAPTPAPQSAASPSPSPHAMPAPKASPTPIPALLNQPTVIVYPFDATSELDPKAGLGIAQIFSQILAGSHNVKVLAVGENVKRQDFQKNAVAKHADYYIAGYVQPIGTQAAVVAQLVDVTSGTSAFSQTAQVASLQDVASQALTFDTVIAQLEDRNKPTITESGKSTPAPSSTNASGASMNLKGIGGAVQSLFKGKAKPETATPAPAIVKPPRGVFVSRLAGNATAGVLTSATATLARALSQHYTTRMSTVGAANVAKSADAICGVKRDNTVVSGVLDVTREGRNFSSHDVFDFTLNVYACFGAKLYSTKASDRDPNKAIEDAVAAYAGAHPGNN